MKLSTKLVDKPWGREKLPPMFGPTSGGRIGEVWFAGPDDLPLLVKYIFTSERLSIQVHPSDEEARERGLPQGKSECWYILDAEPGATLGLGFRRDATREEMRAAALDGSIEELIDWRPVGAGEFYYVPSGTVHAIGPGISLLEFQQNADVTYRLYDYGRPRELHLDDAVAVAHPARYPAEHAQHVDFGEDRVLVDGPKFTLVQCIGRGSEIGALSDRRRWVMPLDGPVRTDSEDAGPGECLLIEPGERISAESGRVLVGAET